MQFNSLEEHTLFARSEMIPAFYPLTNDVCTVDEQEVLYNWIRQVLHSIYKNPLLLYPKTREDYSFPNPFTAVGSGHEEVMAVFHRERKDVDKFILFLMDLGRSELLDNNSIVYNGNISKRYQTILELNGIAITNGVLRYDGKPLFKALSWFVQLPYMTRVRFERLIFDATHDYYTDMLAHHMNQEQGAIEMILAWLNDNGYKKAYILDKYDKDESYMVSYIKNITGKPAKLALPHMGDNAHIGLSMQYWYTALHPFYLTIRIQGMKQILTRFDSLEDNLKAFLVRNAKKCDNCRYCVQTDKTNTRPMARVACKLDEKVYLLCPLFAGFAFSFRDITIKDAQDIISMMQLVKEVTMSKI